MQLSANLQRRNPAPTFLNHTPRAFEITAPSSPSQSPDIAAGMAFSAGLSYTNAMMGQAPSAQQREAARKASSSILREDSIHVQSEESVADDFERPDSWSMHHDCTNQAPYAPISEDEMMTQSSSLRLPKGNASHDLALFLKMTGPTAPHRRPSKLEHPKKARTAPRNALRFLKLGQRRAPASVTNAHHDLNDMLLMDEGGLLLPENVEQKLSSTGKKYLALKIPDDDEKIPDTAPVLNTEILESRISVSFAEEATYDYSNWLHGTSKERLWHKTPVPSRQPSVVLGAEEENTVRMVFGSSPIRPEASNPPTPQPESATSIAESYRIDLNDHPATHSMDATRALSSHPVQYKRSASSPMPKIALPHEEFPVNLPSAKRKVEIKHPSPRRFASHPVLLQQASSIASVVYQRDVTDSPGPPPPKSPLRLRRDPRSIEGMITSELRRTTPKIAPIIPNIDQRAVEGEDSALIIPSVVTACTGPISRPRSREKNLVKHPLYPASRKEREERIRQRKMRDKPYLSHTIDSVVNAEPAQNRRLRKARPQIQIPDLKPAPLATRASSSASSSASWKKVTENTLTPVSVVPSEEEFQDGGEKTGYTPVSPATSNESPNSGRICLSPMMLVAEEVPVPRVKSPPKPTRLILRGEGTKYAPRPRSASMSRTAMKRRSRSSIASVSRPATPNSGKRKDDTPPLPSPPPQRALPPTPPASSSEKVLRSKLGSNNTCPTERKKELPVPPEYEILPPAPLATRHSQTVPHVATQYQRTSTSSKGSANKNLRIDARLEALERQNALLSAALMAVLKTNGQLNAPLAPLNALTESNIDGPKSPMAWENRVARRSAASHAASSSNGSALEMYMSTRRGSKNGS